MVDVCRHCIGVAYCITPYATIKLHNHGRYLLRSPGHWQLSSVVTQSQAVFGWSGFHPIGGLGEKASSQTDTGQ